MLFDMGHIEENLYLVCALLNLGTCASAAFEGTLSNQLFNLDGKEETIIYSQTLGTIEPSTYQRLLNLLNRIYRYKNTLKHLTLTMMVRILR